MAVIVPEQCATHIHSARISRLISQSRQQSWQLHRGMQRHYPKRLTGRQSGGSAACSSLTAFSAPMSGADVHTWGALVLISATGHVSLPCKHYCGASNLCTVINCTHMKYSNDSLHPTNMKVARCTCSVEFLQNVRNEMVRLLHFLTYLRS